MRFANLCLDEGMPRFRHTRRAAVFRNIVERKFRTFDIAQYRRMRGDGERIARQ